MVDISTACDGLKISNRSEFKNMQSEDLCKNKLVYWIYSKHEYK